MKKWELFNYLNLVLCIIGQITVGWFFLFAQFLYLFANGIGIIRDIKIKLPTSNLIRDIVFFAITLGLIIIKLFG